MGLAIAAKGCEQGRRIRIEYRSLIRYNNHSLLDARSTNFSDIEFSLPNFLQGVKTLCPITSLKRPIPVSCPQLSGHSQTSQLRIHSSLVSLVVDNPLTPHPEKST